MKKIKKAKILILLFAVFMTLVACSSKGGKVVYVREQNGEENIITIEYDGKENVQKIISESEGEYGGSELEKQMMEAMKSGLDKIKGAEFNVEYKDKTVKATFTIDMPTFLKENEDSEYKALVDEDGNVPLKTVKENYENLGYKEKE
ncbi:MAG: hypothetical protein WAO56_11395 [Miniphocaeibacter sp.]|uniref:hypothetical protein n=1 Tax=Miniphocaeibacter sp. TaxID=3100973 RepID=UPI00185736A9|nr:YehR family protein [Gallicola sp.]